MLKTYSLFPFLRAHISWLNIQALEKTLSIFTDQEGAKESHRKCKTRTKVGILGLEPRTSTLSGWHSNHLNYMPIRDLCSPMTLT